MKTGIKGVSYRGKRFYVNAWNGDKKVYVGTYDTLEEAEKAYLEWGGHPKKKREYIPSARSRYEYKRDHLVSDEIIKIVEDVFRRMIESDKKRTR